MSRACLAAAFLQVTAAAAAADSASLAALMSSVNVTTTQELNSQIDKLTSECNKYASHTIWYKVIQAAAFCGLWFIVGCSRLDCTAITHVRPTPGLGITELPHDCSGNLMA